MPAARDDINYLSSRCGPVIGPDQRRRAATGQPAKDTDYSNRKYRVSFPWPDAEVQGVSKVSNLPDWNKPLTRSSGSRRVRPGCRRGLGGGPSRRAPTRGGDRTPERRPPSFHLPPTPATLSPLPP